jgi:hypothetical protein
MPCLLLAKAQKVGFITELEGHVMIYRDIGVKTSKKKRIKIAKYEKKRKQVFYALKYEKLYGNDVIRTGKESKAKIILKDKNVIFVDQFGKLRIPRQLKGKKSSSIFDLAYGKVRGIVVKTKRDKLQVPTPAAVMGIRGTDFMINYSPYKNKTEVAVLRGEVTLTKKAPKKKKKAPKKVEVVKAEAGETKKVEPEPAPEPAPEPIVVKAGYTAAIKAKPVTPSPILAKELPEEIKKQQAEPEAKEEIIAPKKITLQKLDEAKVIAMVKSKPEKEIQKTVVDQKEFEEMKKEAIASEVKAVKKIEKDIVKTEKKSTKKKADGKVDINTSVEKLLDKKLEDEGIDKVSYKKVPVEVRVKARDKGMKSRELTPRNIREKSKSDPEMKSIFDSYIEVF